MAIDYGTQRLVSSGVRPPAPPPSVGALAGSMNRQQTPIGINPNLMVPGSNPRQPSTVGRPVMQPMRQLDFSGGQQQLPPPGNLPQSDTTTQTGQGGGQSTLPGPSEGQPGQAQGVGRTPVTPGLQPPNPGILPVTQRPVQTVATTPRQTGAPPNPGLGTIATPKPTPNSLKTPVAAPAWDSAQGILNAMNARHAAINKPGPAVKLDPYYASLSGQGAPKAPVGGDTTQQFNSNFQPTGSTAFSKLAQDALQRQLYGQKGVDLQNMPKSFTIADFNNTAQTNPVLAVQMLGKGGQAYKDAIMKANGWSTYQMNQFINAYGSGAEPGITQANLTQAGFTPDRFGTNTLTPVPPPTDTTAAPPPPPPPPPVTTPPADQGTEAGYGYFSPYWSNLYGGGVR